MTVNVDGELITNKQMVLHKWKEDFAGLYSLNNDDYVHFDNEFYMEAERIVRDKEHEMSSATYDENEDINGHITYDEVFKTVNKLKKNKGPWNR